jgi:peptide/nickel transport system permease protein
LVKFLVARLAQSGLLLLLVSMIGYALILSTGDPMAAYSASPSISAEDVLRLRKDYGLDRPVYVQYGYWLRNLLAGNWGRSYVAQQPVIEMLAQRLPNTAILISAAYALTLLIGIPLGVVSAVRQYSTLDYVATGLAFIGLSMPVFWLGLMLMGVFAVQFKLAGLPYLPTGGMYDLTTGPSLPGLLRHLVLPSVTLAAALTARYVRYARASMLEVLHQDYMRTARAKGLREAVLLRRHGFKNAAIPVVSLIGVDLPLLLSGTVVTESIFGWPGMGRLFFEHSLQVDVPVLMGVLMVSSALVILGSLLADIAYAWIDPRIRYR